MSKGWRNNLILALILAAATGGLWFLDAQEKQRDAADKKSRALSSILAKEVVSAEFHDDKGASVTMTKPEGQWQITSPKAVRTDTKAVQTLLEVLDKTYEQKISDLITDPVPFGLETPTARLIVKDQAGQSLRLMAGSTAPASKKRYVSLGEKGPVVLIEDKELTGLLQKSDALRDKRLISLQAEEISRLVLTRKEGTKLVLNRDKESHWYLELPLQDRGDDNRIRTWMFALTGANGTGFNPERPKGDGDWTLELTSTKGETETITIWKNEPNLLVARPGEPDFMALPQYLVEEFNRSAMEVVSLRPMELSTDMTTLQLEQAGQTLTADKQEKKWPRHEWSEIETVFIQDTYHGVPLKTGQPPWLTITVGKGEQAKVFVFHQEDKSIFISVPKRPVSLELTPLQAENLQKAVTALFTPADAQPAKSEVKPAIDATKK